MRPHGNTSLPPRAVSAEDGLTIWRSGQRTGGTTPAPVAPAIILHYPKYPHNVGQVVRLASCYGIPQVWYSGNRVALDGEQRLPREERMRGYQDVTLIRDPDPLARMKEHYGHRICPVAVELRPNSEFLPDFVHPDHPSENEHYPVYIFGPEDGSLPGPILKECWRFVAIPSFQCLNLATAVATVLYDRMAKMPPKDRPIVKDRGVSSWRGDLSTSSHFGGAPACQS
jgi:tRNA(Leu) C34 or U34 (ribose-2'-O)-methylase TrmL